MIQVQLRAERPAHNPLCRLLAKNVLFQSSHGARCGKVSLRKLAKEAELLLLQDNGRNLASAESQSRYPR